MALTKKKAKAIYTKEGYDKLSDDNTERLIQFSNDNFNNKDIKKMNDIIEDVENTVKFTPFLSYTLNEIPLTSHRPRAFRNTFYVVNSKENKEAFKVFKETFLTNVKNSVHPIRIILKVYKPIPKVMNKFEKYLCEYGLGECIATPDVDNIFKAYTDTLSNEIMLDDRLITSTTISKYYSLKPRIEVCIEEQNSYVLKHNYNNIRKTKTFKKLNESNLTRELVHYTHLNDTKETDNCENHGRYGNIRTKQNQSFLERV